MTRQEPVEGKPDAMLDVLQEQLRLNLAMLSDESLDVPAYFASYDLVDVEELWIEAQEGVEVRHDNSRERTVDIDVRVGSRALDNSHGSGSEYGPNGLGSGAPVSMDDVPLALAQALWSDTEAQYRDAVAAFTELQSSEELRTEDEGRDHPDFSQRRSTVHIEPPLDIDLVRLADKWRPAILAASHELDAHPNVIESRVVLIGVVQNRYFVDSDGSRVQGGSTRLRILFEAFSQAEDGMRLYRSDGVEVHRPDQLPSREALLKTASRLREELLALRAAPVAEPYTGPAVLEGRAAGVFFHEIFGHRLEGHRQKDDLEGQTFTEKLDKRVLPWFLDVVDDPTVYALGERPLSGHYFVDDEGVPAQRTILVERGKLKTFLLSRSPVLPFRQSNGHGRRERGFQAMARQGNLIVTSRKSMSRNQLRAELIAEIRRQGKPYGLWFSDIEGGYTTTDRSGPQAFKVLPLMVYRVYASGRRDELVRGVDIVGTPLAAFETIIATDDQPGIFNGMCGAESGWVPVSAVSPSILLRNLEIERGVHERERPPLLPPPPVEERTKVEERP